MRNRRKKISLKTVSRRIRTVGIIGAYTLSVFAALIALSAGLIFAHDVLTQIDRFAVVKIGIDGNRRLSEKEILHQAEISPGVNLFSVNLSLVRKRLLAHPWVASAEVGFEIPDRLTLRIVEQIPLAVLDLGRKFILNAEGFIFKELSEKDRLDLPVIEGLDYSDMPLPGTPPEEVPFGAVITLLSLCSRPDSLLGSRGIQKIRVDREWGLSIEASGSGTVIKLGFRDYPEKIRRLGKILSYCSQTERFNKLRWIDLNDLDRIVVQPVREAAVEGDKKEA